MAAPLRLGPDPSTGRKLGKYEIVCRLSLGGMSEIFLAFHQGAAGFRKYVVLKRILPFMKEEEQLVQMFLDEARITATFSHPNIAQVYDLDRADDDYFLVMEFVPGATLVEIFQACSARGEPMPIGLTLAAVRDTANALHYAHHYTDPAGKRRPVIHRDVAQKNIMMTYEGATKLLDFGIARRLDRSQRTQAGVLKGTTGYMSPEQIKGQDLDGRSDIFSLGIVLHECLTGQRLFARRQVEEELFAALYQEVEPPSWKNPEVPQSLDEVVLKALSRDREDRFVTARDFARAIERAAPGLVWDAEQCGELVQRMFAERREQTKELLEEVLSARPTIDAEAADSDLHPPIGGLADPRQPLATLREPTDKDLGFDPTQLSLSSADRTLIDEDLASQGFRATPAKLPHRGSSEPRLPRMATPPPKRVSPQDDAKLPVGRRPTAELSATNPSPGPPISRNDRLADRPEPQPVRPSGVGTVADTPNARARERPTQLGSESLDPTAAVVSPAHLGATELPTDTQPVRLRSATRRLRFWILVGASLAALVAMVAIVLWRW